MATDFGFKRISPVPLAKAVVPPKLTADELVKITKAIVNAAEAPAPVSPFSPTTGTLLYADSDDGIRGHYKQWSIEQNGQSVTTRWGKVGAVLQSNTKKYGTEHMAREMVRKTVAAKRAKGYRDKK